MADENMKGIGLRTLDMASLIAGAKVYLLIFFIIILLYMCIYIYLSIHKWIDTCNPKGIRIRTLDMASLIAGAKVTIYYILYMEIDKHIFRTVISKRHPKWINP